MLVAHRARMFDCEDAVLFAECKQYIKFSKRKFIARLAEHNEKSGIFCCCLPFCDEVVPVACLFLIIII